MGKQYFQNVAKELSQPLTEDVADANEGLLKQSKARIESIEDVSRNFSR